MWKHRTSGRASGKRRLRTTYRVDRLLGSRNVERLASKQQLGPQHIEYVDDGLKLASIVKHAPPKRVERFVRAIDAVVQFRDFSELLVRGRENLNSSLGLGYILQSREPSVAPAVGEGKAETDETRQIRCTSCSHHSSRRMYNVRGAHSTENKAEADVRIWPSGTKKHLFSDVRSLSGRRLY